MERTKRMPDIEKVISDLNDLVYREREYLAEIGQTEPSGIERILGDALALLKEQEAIIEQYRRADGFLAVHGWKWESR